VLKVCANHYINPDMRLTPLSASDRAWCYTASDYAEGETRLEKLALKFKSPEKAQEFKSTFENCQKEIVEGESKQAAKPNSPTKDKAGSAQVSVRVWLHLCMS
jgi:hypothetical protein